ncbi:glycosyltransferase family 2 protein [Novipirellula maiorica]|uniref:glycosyltransferase family 2 protein n=1 Tax=Novipirellula maiorica TaxID=1265734 RepID=UPI001F389E29|nr:glycosyltransferase family 2 protein [Rhodopirellula maiorica]
MQVKSPPLRSIPLGPLPAKPLVSILVPSYNQGRFIRHTIDSILQQDYRPLKIHVVDGASSDNTVNVLKSYGEIPELEWISEPDKGVVDAVNKGFDRLEGDICGIQSSDDLYLPGVIQRIVDQFHEFPKTGLIYGDTVKVDAEGNELLRYQIGPWSFKNIFLMKTWIPQPSTFFRREMLVTCGGWDDRIPYAPDTDLWLRMAFRTDVKKIDHYLSSRRMHDAQRDTQAAKIIRDYSRMIDQSSDIASASANIRSAAEASKHLIWQRYNPTGSDMRVAWHLMRAGMACPAAWNTKGIVRNALLPIRRQLSRVKQALFATKSTKAGH